MVAVDFIKSMWIMKQKIIFCIRHGIFISRRWTIERAAPLVIFSCRHDDVLIRKSSYLPLSTPKRWYPFFSFFCHYHSALFILCLSSSYNKKIFSVQKCLFFSFNQRQLPHCNNCIGCWSVRGSEFIDFLASHHVLPYRKDSSVGRAVIRQRDAADPINRNKNCWEEKEEIAFDSVSPRNFTIKVQ